MKTRDVIIGIIVVALLTMVVLAVKNKRDAKLQASVTPTPSAVQKINDKFGGLDIPVDAEKAELNDVTGGNGYGIATRTEVLADLPTPAKPYQVWLDKDGKKLLLGTLRSEKGGYLLEYNSAKFPGYDKVIITEDGKSILEGSF